MALEPYRQRTRAPSAPATTGVVSTRVGDVGRQISALGKQIMDVAAPMLAEHAKEQALADFAAEGLGKDEEGNYVLPETPNGGVVYTKVFDEAKREAFVFSTLNDAELRLNAYYSNPENITKDPLEVRTGAQAIIKGYIDATPDELKNVVLNNLSRELRERDRVAFNRHASRQYELTGKEIGAAIESNMEKAAQAWELGTEEATAQALIHEKNAIYNAERMVQLGYQPESFLEEVKTALADARMLGGVKALFRTSADNLSSVEIQQMVDVVEGTAEGSVLGLSQEEIFKLSPKARASLAQWLDGARVSKYRVERANAEAYEKSLTIPNGGQGFGESDERFAKRYVAFAQQNGIDPTDPVGAVTLIQAFGNQVPEKYYQNLFDDAANKPIAELEKLRTLRRVLLDIPDGEGGTLSFNPIKREDNAFLYHYDLAIQEDIAPAEAKRRAREAVNKGLSENPKDAMKFLEKRYGKAGDNVLSTVAKEIGTTWGNLNTEARSRIAQSLAANLAFGLPDRVAVKQAINEFKEDFTQSRYDIQTATAFASNTKTGNGIFSLKRPNPNKEEMAWLPKDMAIPSITDANSPKGTKTQDWIQGFLPEIAQMAGEQTPGVPPVDKMKFGKNLWVQAATPRTKNGNQLFRLVYFDPQNPGVPSYLKDKEGRTMLVDLGRAASLQDRFAQAVVQKRAGNIREDVEQMGDNEIVKAIAPLFSIKPIGRIAGSISARLGASASETARNAIGDISFNDETIAALEKKGIRLANVDGKNIMLFKPSVDAIKVNTVKPGERFSPSSNFDISIFEGKVLKHESGGNPNARNPRSSAEGLHQFIDSTWLQYYRKTFPTSRKSDREILRLKTNPSVSRKVFETFTMDNVRKLEDAGIPINDVTVYASHWFGVGDAIRMFTIGAKRPDTPLTAIKPKNVLEANGINPSMNIRTFINYVLRPRMGM